MPTLTFAQRRGVSLKVSDEFTVPLCAVHHDELHRAGQERQWWEGKAVDPLPVASTLWGQSRVPSRMGMEPAAGMFAKNVERVDPTANPPNGPIGLQVQPATCRIEALSA
jgi:hypothetical protein